MWQRQKVSLILSVKLVQRSASEKKNEPYFLMTARKVCSIRSMGCCWQRPWRMFDLSPLLLWSEEKLCSWAVSPCFSIHSNAVYGENWRKGWKQRTSNHRRYHFTGEAEWFAWWLRPMKEQPEKNKSYGLLLYILEYLTTPVSISVSKYEEIHSAKTIHIVVLKKAENNSCLFVLVNKSN